MYMKAGCCEHPDSEYTILMLIHSYPLLFICIVGASVTSSLLYKRCAVEQRNGF